MARKQLTAMDMDGNAITGLPLTPTDDGEAASKAYVDANAGGGSNSFITNEVPTGTIDNVNTTFYTSMSYIPNSLEVYINGLAQGDLTYESDPTTGEFIVPDPLLVGDHIAVSYQHTTGTSDNADTVDGYHASTSGAPGTIPVYDEDGNLPGGVDSETILQVVYPVGSLYLNAANATNPATLLGFGTWEVFGAGRTLVSLNSEDPDFDTAGETGGAKTHTLTESEMPSHTHTQNSHSHSVDPPSATTSSDSHTHNTYVGYKVAAGSTATVTGAPGDARGNATTSDSHSHTVNIGAFTSGGATATNQSTGGDMPHNNMPPYVVVYMWQRTA